MNKYLTIFLGIILILSLSGCFRKFTMSEKEVSTYYKTHFPKPNFYSYDTLNRKIFYAYANQNRLDLPLLIFIHGAPGAWYGYIHYLEDTFLLNRFRIISVDRVGYNHSMKGGVDVSIENQATYLLPLLKLRGNTNCVIAGRSYGAPIAAKMAAIQPNNIKALLLISCAADPEQEKFWWFSKPIYYPPLRWLFPTMIRYASDEKFAHKKELNKLLSSWKLVKQPAIILQGAKDFIIYPSNGKFTDSVLVNSPHKYKLLPENGHLISNENPEIIRQSLNDLLLMMK